MAELVHVFLHHLGGRFTEIRKVGYRFLRRQPDGKFVHLLVWLFNDEHVRVTFGCHCRLMSQHVMDFLVQADERHAGPPVAATPVHVAEPSMPENEPAAMDDSEFDFDDSASTGSSSADSIDGDECIPETARAGCSRYVLPAPPPIPRLEDVPCFFQQLDLDEEGACDDPLNSGMCNDYNTDGGAELRVGHRLRNRDAVQTAIKNYSIRRNAEYRVIESDRIKYHCRCKHAEDGCPWRIRVAFRPNLGYW
ncbi:hypothetical protein PIB30_075557 [Stylosanthes scabra]|uniref:Transposase MuDR plant domain-containing protein n=1 Tax=Stylosanthes scabra TaxID=79078 RepID=A0ABU6VRW6_9FABA|nr:hypothetical protein [Stylosanthes scabra]